MSQVQVGKVTTSNSGRLHLNINGHAKCGSGQGRILAGTSRELAATEVPNACRRCLPAIAAAATVRPLRQQPPTDDVAPGMVRVRIGRGYVDRPIRPLSPWGQLRAAHAAATAKVA